MSFTVLPWQLNTCFEVAVPSEGIPRHGRYGASGLAIATMSAFNNQAFRISGHVDLGATFDCVELS